MAIDWNGIDIEERFKLFMSSLIEEAGLNAPDEAEMDICLEQDFADILKRIEVHMNRAISYPFLE